MTLPSRVLRNGSRYVLSNRLHAIGKAPLVSPTLIRIQCLATIRAEDGHDSTFLPHHLSLPLEHDEQVFGRQAPGQQHRAVHNIGVQNHQETTASSSSSSQYSNTTTIDRDPLPTSLNDIFQDDETTSDRAIVMTEMHAPFRIVHVNTAWEGLCGYKLDECRGKSLGMLQGPETDLSTATSLLHQLLRGEEGGAILTNYTKEGRRFRNYLRVGPLQKEPFFVGLLQEIEDGQ